MTADFWASVTARAPVPLTRSEPCPACGGAQDTTLVLTPGTEHEWHTEDCPAMAHGIPVALSINGSPARQVLAVPVVEGQDPVAAVGAAIAEFGRMLIRYGRGEPL